MPIGRAVSISRRAKSIVTLNISTRSFFIALYNTNNESSIKIVLLIICEAYPSGVPTASMLRGCSRARNQNPGIFLVCRGHLHPEVWRRRSQARLRRRLCCRERNGCSEWLKSCGKHSRRSKISAGFNAIWRSRVNRLSRRNRSRVGFRLEGTAVFSGPNSVYKQHRLCDKQSHENKFGDGRKGSVSIPFGCMPMPQSYLIPFEGYFLDLSVQARPSGRSPRAEDIFPHRAGQ